MNSKYSLKQVSAGLIVSFCLALFITNISASGPRFENRDEVIHNQLAILSGNPHIIGGKTVRFPQFQARILFPILLATISKVEVLSMREWYIVLRIVTAFAAFSVFFFVSLYWIENNAYTVFLGMALLTYGLVFTFNHPWEHPSDFLDVLFYSLFLHYILSKNRIALLLIVLFATLNHQTAAFAGIIWLVLYGFSTTRNIVPKEILYSGALMVGSYLLSTLIKYFYSDGFSIGYVINGYLTISHFLEFLDNPNPYGWPIMLMTMHIPLVLWLVANRKYSIEIDVRILVAVVVIIVVSSPIAFWSEIRSVFLGPYVILTFLAVCVHSRRKCISL